MKTRKIMLVYPNFKWIKGYEGRTLWRLHPYNICLLAAILERKYNVKIVDANFDDLSLSQFKDDISKYAPDIVGISLNANEYVDSGLIAAEAIKSVNPGIKVVFGGSSVIFNPDYIMSKESVDFAVCGEAEVVFPILCDYLFGLSDLPKTGILFGKDGKVINLGMAEYITDLDSLPLPAYHLVYFKKYANAMQRESTDRPRDLPYARIITSRGCPFRCCFCAAGVVSGKKIRYRSPDNIMAEIDFLVKEYGIKSMMIDDDNILVDRDRAIKFFKLLISRNYNLKWNAMAMAVFKLDEELLDLIKQSGCQYINVAIESGVERVLKTIIHKPVDLDQAKYMVSKIKGIEIDVVANFVIGFPGETWNEIRKTIKYAEDLDVDYIKIFIATPFPNTELYRIAKESGSLIENYDINNHLWTDGFIRTPEFRPQDLKIFRAYEWDRINFSDSLRKKKIAVMMNVTEERLDEIRKTTLARANP